jgi:hypothetical protein
MEKEHTQEYYDIMEKPPNALTRYGFLILLTLLSALIYCTMRYWAFLSL